jgi:hypothetical protein
MFTRIFAALAIVFVVITGLVLAAGDTTKGNCCDQKLACCQEDSKCCSKDEKPGCCDQGMKCCAEDKACCQSAAKCCVDGDKCCDEPKACCDKESSQTKIGAAVPACCLTASETHCCPAEANQG